MDAMAGPSSRMLALLSLLQVHRDWPGDELAERLDVSPRTVRRDVDRLRGLGYRVEAVSGPAGGYRLEAGSDLPPLLFDDDQAVAIALALAVAPASGADIAESAARALADGPAGDARAAAAPGRRGARPSPRRARPRSTLRSWWP